MADLTSRLTTLQATLATYTSLHTEGAEIGKLVRQIDEEGVSAVANAAVFIPTKQQFQTQRDTVSEAVKQIGEYERVHDVWKKGPGVFQKAKNTLYLFPDEDRDHFDSILENIEESNLDREQLVQDLQALQERAHTKEAPGFWDVAREMGADFFNALTADPREEKHDLEEGAPTSISDRQAENEVEETLPTTSSFAVNREDYARRLDAAIKEIQTIPLTEPTDPGAKPLADALGALSDAYRSEMTRLKGGLAEPAIPASFARRWSWLKGLCWFGVAGSFAGGGFVFRRWGCRMGIGLAVPGSLGSLTGAWGSTRREHLWAEEAVEGFYRNHGFAEAEEGRLLDFATFKGWLKGQSPGRAVLNAAARLG